MPWSVRLSWLENAYIYAHFCQWAILTRKVGQYDLVLVCDQGSLVGLCIQKYKFLRAAVRPMICATAVDPKCDFYVLTFNPCDREKLVKPEISLSVDALMSDAHMKQIW